MKTKTTHLILAAIAVLLPLQAARAQAPSVQIEIGNTPDQDDDFLCWTPIPSRLRLAAAGPADVNITLVSASATPTGGAVQFQTHAGPPITPENFAPLDELPLTLPKDGSWISFHVAGKTASVGQRDIKVQARLRNTATVLGEVLVMVRVRKNANTLTNTERDQFLDAVKRLRDKPGSVLHSRWQDYYATHAEAFNVGIHGGPARNVSNFLPWHRAFLLSLERELQAINSNVVLPYWKFDAPAPNLFTPDFLGTVNREGTSSVPASNVEVQFSGTNKLKGWSFDDQLLRRGADWKTGQPIPPNRLSLILCDQPAVPCPVGADQLKNVTFSFEESYHNMAHGLTGGWLGQGFSPADPIFFLLHANTDRAWAHWQAKYRRFNNSGAHEPSYFPTGSYPGAGIAGRFRDSLYALDAMWPWNGKRGNGGTPADSQDDWPDFEYPFPAAVGRPLGPTARPTPVHLIDYLGTNAASRAIGACYDDLGFKGRL